MLALIPLRGGSKGIPDKNIKDLAGKPLCQWVIDTALEADIFETITVSTDSEKIADIVCSHNGNRINVLMRPPELAQDNTPTEKVIEHVLEKDESLAICLIQATSPLTAPVDLLASRAKFYAWGCDSLLSVVRYEKFFWQETWIDDCIEPINYNPFKRPMRQEGIKPLYLESGNFYMFHRGTFVRHNCRVGKSVGRYIIPRERALDIDTLEDFEQAEQFLKEAGK